MKLTQKQWRKVAEVAESLAWEFLGATDGRKAVQLGTTSWDTCLVGEVHRRAGLPDDDASMIMFGILFESLLDPSIGHGFGAATGILSEATREYVYGSLLPPQDAKFAPVIPLLYLADRAREKAKDV